MSKAEKTREQIIRAASAAIRSMGPDRVSVAQIMARLDLTHGGFYAHFSSKDELVAAALDAAFKETFERLGPATDGKPPLEALAACIDAYVSADMRDFPERACPLTTSAGEVARLTEAGRRCLSDGVERTTAVVESLLRAIGRPQPEIEALSVVSEMVGSVSLARTVADPVRSDLFLRATRAALKARLGLPTR